MVKPFLDDNVSAGEAIGLRADRHDIAHLCDRGRVCTEVLESTLGEDRQLVTANVANGALTGALDGGFSIEVLPTSGAG